MARSRDTTWLLYLCILLWLDHVIFKLSWPWTRRFKLYDMMWYDIAWTWCTCVFFLNNWQNYRSKRVLDLLLSHKKTISCDDKDFKHILVAAVSGLAMISGDRIRRGTVSSGLSWAGRNAVKFCIFSVISRLVLISCVCLWRSTCILLAHSRPWFARNVRFLLFY